MFQLRHLQHREQPMVDPIPITRFKRFKFDWNWLLWRFFYLFLIATVGSVLAFAIFRPILVLPRIRLAPGYAMRDIHRLELVNSDSLRGGLTLYSFTFVDCLAPLEGCGISHSTLDEVAAEYLGLADADLPLHFVTILLDEDLDLRREKNGRLMTAFPERMWLHSNGDRLQTRYVVGQGFNLFYDRPNGNEDTKPRVAPTFVLVDGTGMIRAEYRSGRPDFEILARDVALLRAEFKNRDGINRIGYEAAHLFVCYP